MFPIARGGQDAVPYSIICKNPDAVGFSGWLTRFCWVCSIILKSLIYMSVGFGPLQHDGHL